MQQETFQTRKDVEKGSENGSLLAWQKRAKGVDKRLEGSFVDLPVIWCAFGVQFCSFYLFSDIENDDIWLKI